MPCMLQEITLQYNLCNEPWLKYTMTAVSDRGLKPSQWASARLHSEVLYLESHRQRYELSRVDASASSGNEANSVSSLPGPLTSREDALRCCPCSMFFRFLWFRGLQGSAVSASKKRDRACNATMWCSVHAMNMHMGLCWTISSPESIVWCAQQGETYRWAICKEPLPLVEMRHVGVPLPAKHVEILHSSLAWEDLQVHTPAHTTTTLQAHVGSSLHCVPRVPFLHAKVHLPSCWPLQ